jgi:ketosteroid isomerase-like protein
LLRDAYALWHDSKGGSVDHWIGLVSENISFGSVAGGAVSTLPFATFYDARVALRGYFQLLLRDWEMIYFNAQEFVAHGEAVVMRGSTAWRNRNTGKVFATPKLDCWRFRNGKAIEVFEFFDTAGAVLAATAEVSETACSDIASP